MGGGWGGAGGGGRGGEEKGVRAALEATRGHFEAGRALEETLSATKRTREAAREFELAVASAPTPADEARMLFRLANERTRLGAYDESLDAYEREIALGDTEPAALANSAELLMARGDLIAAIDRYREAVAIEERAPNRREHLQGMALGYFGLAVALDRQGAALASREAMGRALALDPGLTVLRVAGQSDTVYDSLPSVLPRKGSPRGVSLGPVSQTRHDWMGIVCQSRAPGGAGSGRRRRLVRTIEGIDKRGGVPTVPGRTDGRFSR